MPYFYHVPTADRIQNNAKVIYKYVYKDENTENSVEHLKCKYMYVHSYNTCFCISSNTEWRCITPSMFSYFKLSVHLLE